MINSKSVFLLLSILWSTSPANAQYSEQPPKHKDFERFFTTKTLVVLDTSEQYNEAIKREMKASWTITPFDFITQQELVKSYTDPTLSFIMPVTQKQFLESGLEHGGGADHMLSYLVCVVGGGRVNRKGKIDFEPKDFIAYAPIDYQGMESPPNQCAWRMSCMIPVIQNAINLRREHEIRNKYDYTGLYAEKTALLKTKTLLISDEYMKGTAPKYKRTNMSMNFYGNPVEPSEIKEMYKYKYRIVKRDEIITAMDTKQEDVCILFKVSSYGHYVFVYDPSIKEVIYSLVAPEGPYLAKGHFKWLTRCINNAEPLKEK